MNPKSNPGLFYPRYPLRGKRIMLLGILFCLIGAAIAAYGIYQLFLPHIVGVPQTYVRIGILACLAGYVLYWIGRIVHWYYWR